MANDWVTGQLDMQDKQRALKQILWWLQAKIEQGEEPTMRDTRYGFPFSTAAEAVKVALATLEEVGR